MPSKKTLANIKSPVVQALINAQYRFNSEEDALKKVEHIKSRFVESKKAKEAESDKNAVIWVKDYEVTPEEKESGLLGNFMLVSVKLARNDKTGDKDFFLGAEKLPAEAKFHPKRIRPKQSTADFGHFVLRRVQKNWWYPTIEEANHDLELLAKDYPDVSIPATNKLYTMIYRKAEKGEKPVKRYVLEVIAADDGGFHIKIEENTYVAKKKPARKTPPKVAATAGDDETAAPEAMETKGKFTAQEQLKRSRKKK